MTAPQPISRDDLPDVIRAAEILIDSQFGSVSMVQRKTRLGFAHTQRLFAILEAHGVVGPAVGSMAREVLVTAADKAAVLDKLRGAAE